MSKGKPAKASKRARSPKTAEKAQRANQAVVRSSKPSRKRSAAAGSTASPSELHNISNQEVPVVEKTTLPVPERMAAVVRDDSEQAMNDSKQAFGFSSVAMNAHAHPAKLLEIALANMQLTLEFAQRLAAIKSPFEIPGFFAELTSKQMAMYRNLVLSNQSLSRR